MSDTEEDSKDKSKRPLEVSSEGNDEVEEKRSSRKRGKNLKTFRPLFAFQAMIGQLLTIIPNLANFHESLKIFDMR